MQKVLSLLALGVLSISAIGQAQQPATNQPPAKANQSKGTVAKSQNVGTKKPKTTAHAPNGTAEKNVDLPEPTPSPPPDPEADKKRFEEALAAPTAAEKARLLRLFIDEFPVSLYSGEALEYLVTARAMAGSESLETGAINDAMASFRLVVDEAPLPIPDRLYNDVVLKTVLNLYQRGRIQAAFELAGRIEKKIAGNSKQLLGMATFYLGTENGNEARRLAEAAIEADPASAAGYQALGLAHRLNFELEASAAAYAKAVELDEASIAARRSLAEMKRALGRSDEAAAVYRSLLSSNEADTASRTGLVLSLFDAGRRSQAEAELASALERDPRNFALLAGAAYWYAANNQPARAIEYAQKAIDAEPRYVWGYVALARGLMKENRPVDAERTLIKARQYGNFPTLDYEIASARYMAGLYREAIEELGKNFTFKDGLVRTKLGGRIPSEGKTFQEAVGSERRASILAPVAADDAEASERMRLLFEISKKIDSSPDDAELSVLADEFVGGDDKMKLHRQLYVAQIFLQKNVALPKVAELLKASLGSAEAGLDVAAPGAAVMASELYESRTIAFSKNEVLLIPEVPRQTLSAILRGRIEELSGWALFQQKSYPEAAVRLRRAVSILPDKSAWWRSSMWRLGAALEADGKEKEALDSYIESYKTDRPNALKYSVIESLYIKVHGNRDGLEDLIGANPTSAIAGLTPKADPNAAPPISISEREPVHMAKDDARSDPLMAGNSTALPSAERKDPLIIQPDNAASQPKQFDAKALLSEAGKNEADKTDKAESALASKQDSGGSKTLEPPKTETAAPLDHHEIVEPKVNASSTEAKIEKPPIIVRSADARPSDLHSSESPANSKVPIVPLAELLNKKRPAETVETEHLDEGSSPSDSVVLKKLVPLPKVAETVTDVEPTNTEDATADKAAGVKEVTSEAPRRPSGIEEEKQPIETKKEMVPDAPDEKPGQRQKKESEIEPTPTKQANPEPANLLHDPFYEPLSVPHDKSTEKTEVVVKDPLRSKEKSPETKPGNKPIFEPIVITVPQTWKPTGKATDSIKAESAVSSPADPEKRSETASPSGTTRTRLVEGKEVLSDQSCSIEVSDESVSLIGGGGSIGVLVTLIGDGTLKELAASTNSPRDVEVKPEPEIDGLPGRRFYVVRSISTRTGMFQVNFESPCGKKEMTVRVR